MKGGADGSKRLDESGALIEVRWGRQATMFHDVRLEGSQDALCLLVNQLSYGTARLTVRPGVPRKQALGWEGRAQVACDR